MQFKRITETLTSKKSRTVKIIGALNADFFRISRTRNTYAILIKKVCIVSRDSILIILREVESPAE